MTTNENEAFALQSALLRDRELAQKISDYIFWIQEDMIRTQVIAYD